MERSLSDAQIEYYSRQILLREIGGVGQKRLLGAACLLVGGGEAIEVAATYLAGAGIGRLDLVGARRIGGPGSPLAPLAERNPDVRVGFLDRAPPRVDGYAALVVAEPADALLEGAGGRARHGEIRIERHVDGTVALILLPAGRAGCARCARAGEPATGLPQRADAALALAGTLAAIAACRWVAGVTADEPEAVAWRLAVDSPTWEPTAVTLTASCTRGCR
jgi:adenylyltransferase/sulfurtransferase